MSGPKLIRRWTTMSSSRSGSRPNENSAGPGRRSWWKTPAPSWLTALARSSACTAATPKSRKYNCLENSLSAMLLTEHTTTEHNQIRGIEPGRVFVTDQWYSNSLLVGAHYLKHDWPVVELGDFTAEIAAPLVELGPELIIVGAGRRQQFLAPEIQHIFLQAGIGVECMTLDRSEEHTSELQSRGHLVCRL